MQRRKLSNLVIDRGALLRLSLPFFILALMSVATVFAIRAQVVAAMNSAEFSGTENIAAINEFLKLQNNITMIASIGICLICMACFSLWLFFSHRIFGPTVPIRRHIENLIQGEFSSRINLRSGDELKNVAQDLNRLAETLETKKQ